MHSEQVSICRTIDNYLRENTSQPTAENAVKIAQALGVSVEYLVTGVLALQNDINFFQKNIVSPSENNSTEPRHTFLCNQKEEYRVLAKSFFQI